MIPSHIFQFQHPIIVRKAPKNKYKFRQIAVIFQVGFVSFSVLSRPAGSCISVKSQMTAIIKIACGAASEEASCIPLPPRRRKLHIRWLLLPFQTVTAALGHSLG
ncbi:MAG: hypothetical protein DBX57_03795 [Clostridia bacterium]|nr:MAG: hypothetical protein DBX57_03795 [Clostridia bacterium]